MASVTSENAHIGQASWSQTAGMAAATPELRRWPVLAILLCFVLHVWLRYELHWGYGKRWQALHVVVGFGYVVTVLGLAYGRSFFQRLDRSALAILGVSTTCYLLFWYWGRGDTYLEYVAPWVTLDAPIAATFPFLYLSMGALVFRLCIPFTLGRRLARRPWQELGIGRGRGLRASKVVMVYVGLYVVVAPLVWLAASDPAFGAKYPMARGLIAADGSIGWQAFVVYQSFYLLIFVSGEALYRGFMTFGLERQLGLYGIAFSLVPYVCSHFGKPFVETLGAIASGCVLAFVALKHRSIWPGVALHYAVALTMDMSAIARQGYRLI